MDFQQMLMMLPGIDPEEAMVLKHLAEPMSEEQKQQFILFYKGKRKEQQDLLILTIIGFFGVAGIQRFVIGEAGMGVAFLLTGGFCGIGTIIDLVNIKKLCTEYNKQQAMETANMVKMMMK